MLAFTRKLTILSYLLFTGFSFWEAALGLTDVTDVSVDSTAEAAMSPTVSHNVLNIYGEGEETPIGVTSGHPIWSENRQALIRSEKLQPGERLRSAVGRTVRITSIEPRAGPEAVYNLEVAGEHVYSVTDSGLLVHNTGPCDLNAPRVARIAGDAPNVRWKLNPNGLVRSEDEILDLLRRGGVDVPDDVAIFVGEADNFVGTLDDLLAGRNALTARMPGLTEDAAGYVHFNNTYNRFGKIPIQINPSMMASDDAILAVMKHELHELSLFREAFRRGNGRMTFDAFRAEAMPGNPGNYHWQAWDEADLFILWWRGLR